MILYKPLVLDLINLKGMKNCVKLQRIIHSSVLKSTHCANEHIKYTLGIYCNSIQQLCNKFLLYKAVIFRFCWRRWTFITWRHAHERSRSEKPDHCSHHKSYLYGGAVALDSIKDYLSSVVSYSLLFKIHTTLHLTKFTVEYSSSLGIINGNSYSFFFFKSF